MGLPFCVMAAIMVAQSVCGDHDSDLKAQLLSTTVLLATVTTFLQTTLILLLPLSNQSLLFLLNAVRLEDKQHIPIS
jgi:hypothetical protein